MRKIKNKDAGYYTARIEEFKGNNLSAKWENRPGGTSWRRYVVRSYGTAIFVWDAETRTWIENISKYSPTTSKHTNQARPTIEGQFKTLTDEEMERMLRS